MTNNGKYFSTNILAQRLSNLVAAGVLSKRKCPDSGRVVRYGLTEKGKALVPILHEMIIWGADHGKEDAGLAAWAASIRKDREKAFKQALHSIEE